MLSGDIISISGDEVKHITRVMRHSTGDEIFVTDGEGSIYKSKIKSISIDRVDLQITSKKFYENTLGNFCFCLPKIKNQDRLGFAVEKCIELGISKFTFFESERTIKSSIKQLRLEKIAISAMKQSLHMYKPVFTEINSFDSLLNAAEKVIILEQNSKMKLTDLVLNKNINYHFLFGPEGGFSQAELQRLSDSIFCTINSNRLRTETAAVSCASILQTLI